eukprot:scaffold189005_cov30-Tisochrysis_lutea.AAC.7
MPRTWRTRLPRGFAAGGGKSPSRLPTRAGCRAYSSLSLLADDTQHIAVRGGHMDELGWRFDGIPSSDCPPGATGILVPIVVKAFDRPGGRRA